LVHPRRPGARKREFREPDNGDAIEYVTFSPDGRWLATSGYDEKVRVWDARDGKLLTTIADEEWGRVLFTPDSTELLTSHHLYNVRTGNAVSPGLGIDIRALSADGRYAIAVNGYSLSAFDLVANTKAGAEMRPAQLVTDVEFSKQATRIVSSTWEVAEVWDVSRGGRIGGPIHHPAPISLGASVEYRATRNKPMKFGESDTELKTTAGRFTYTWDISPRDFQSKTIELEPLGAAWIFDHTCALSPDGSILLVDGRSDGKPEGHYIALAVQCNGSQKVTELSQFPSSSDDLFGTNPGGISFSPNGSCFIARTSAREISIFSAVTLKPVSRPINQELGTRASFSPDGSQLLTVDNDTATLWDVATTMPVGAPMRHDMAIEDVCFQVDSSRVLTYDHMFLRTWDARTATLLSTVEMADKGWAYVSPRGDRLGLIDNGEFRLRDSRNGTSISTGAGRNNSISHFAFSPAGDRFVTAAWGGIVRIWDATTGQAVSPEILLDSRIAPDVRWSSDGRYVITNGGRLWSSVTALPVSWPSTWALEAATLGAKGEVVAGFWRNEVKTVPAVRVYKLVPDPRPADDLCMLAELLSAQRLDDVGGRIRLTEDEWQERWNILRSKYPLEFAKQK
jgi:WD40 repeat protein